MPLHNEGEQLVLDVFFRGATAPTKFYARLANSLLIRLKSITGTWQTAETATGGTSADVGTVEQIIDNGDGTKTLRLSGFDETDIFAIGETLTGGTSAATGVVDNATLLLLNESGVFALGETVTGGTSSATGKVLSVEGSGQIAIQEITGTFQDGEQISGDESGETADINTVRPGQAGLADDNGISDLTGEPSGNGYAPITFNANTTDFPTLAVDGADDFTVTSVQKQFTASGGDFPATNVLVISDQEYESTIAHGTVTGGPFTVGETITGGTSGATAVVRKVGPGDVLEVDTIVGTFSASETLTGGTSSATASYTSQTDAKLITSSPLKDAPPSKRVTSGSTMNLIYKTTAR